MNSPGNAGNEKGQCASAGYDVRETFRVDRRQATASCLDLSTIFPDPSRMVALKCRKKALAGTMPRVNERRESGGKLVKVQQPAFQS